MGKGERQSDSKCPHNPKRITTNVFYMAMQNKNFTDLFHGQEFNGCTTTEVLSSFRHETCL